MPKVSVLVRLKPTLSDAQGAVVKKALNNLGYQNVKDVRIGKLIDLEIEGNWETEKLGEQVKEMCERLLANPVIEEFEVRLNRGNPHPRTAIATKEEVSHPAFTMSFTDFLRLPDEEQRKLARMVWKELKDWIHQILNQYGAQWVMVIGGKVVRWSDKLDDYPDYKAFLQHGRKSGFVPWVFARSPVVEESITNLAASDWSALSPDDHYPTLNLQVGHPEWSWQRLRRKGIRILADLDTGSNQTLLSYNALSKAELLPPHPHAWLMQGQHLGQTFEFYILPVGIGVTGQEGRFKSKKIFSYLVWDWQQSPLCIVNPNRQALAGRNLLLKFPLIAELDGKLRKTRARHP